ncbi:hypothetical protein GC102_09410 [Paenibacillus sp. LMG 31460]|uniref:BIG2 domain-containing protein n=1 Tax=Paenibacillus germinis TaxID=2654979 RepID=A0ABX1YYF7_9BACL|nr:hypothetical protein [Paenibacillus germinis]NOU85992.1 hypothetical protein [Paenibacillus germinis]
MEIGKKIMIVFLSILLITSAVPVFAKGLVAAQGEPVLITGDFTSVDFNVSAPAVANGTYTLDTKLLGTVATTAGKNLAGLVADGTGSSLFFLEADTASVGSYKAGINKTDRFGIQTRLKFNNTNSQRNVFQMKSMTPSSGTPAWPSLLVFDQNGNIKDSKGNVLGPYTADQWYDIVVDVDTPNHWYSVWINGTLRINKQDLGNWIGVYQNNITQNTNASKMASRTMIAYLKAGSIVPPLQDIIVSDISVDKGKGSILTIKTLPDPAYVERVIWTSSDPSIAKVVGNGLLALNTGVATITATETASGLSRSFQVTVQEPAHAWNSHAIDGGDLAAVLTSASRSELTYSVGQIMTLNSELQTYLDMNESDFIQEVKAASAKISIPDNHTKFEKYARLFAQLYKLTNDPKYARKAALILYYQALDYPRIVVNKNYTDFWGGNYQFPQDVVYTYGTLIDLSIWGELDPAISSAEVKQTIEELWLKPGAYENIRLVNSMPLNNITPYGTRSSAVTGMLLTDPDLIREAIDLNDRLLSGTYYFSDGMWGEETTSYGDQVSGNVKTMVDVLKNWTDPQDYVDTKLGLKLDKTELSSRWPLLSMSTNFSSDKLIYPDGKAIPISDTYGKTGDPQALPIVDKGLKNIELPGLGYYGLFQGDLTEATHAGLLYQPTDLGFAGGHTHSNFLSLDLWGAGVEMLPYTGYLNRTSYGDGSGATLRYPSMRPLWRNMPWVWRQDGANTASTGAWTKPSLLAYDSGASNSKQVQLVEASDPGPDGKGAAMNRRLIMLVNLGGNSNYTFDLTRMQGGQAHEIYQRGSELENMDVQVQDVQLADTGKANLQDYLTSINSTAGLSTDRNQLLKPQAGSGNNSFSFTWTGKQTGASLRTFMNGVGGSDVFLSQIPTGRRTTTKAEESKYVTSHLARRHIVSDSSQITQYGSVYEMFKQGQTGQVSSVVWVKPDDADPMTNFAVVRSNNYVDIIYTSGDMKERNYNGITFAGNIAVARTDAVTGNLVYSYVNGPGKVAMQAANTVGYGTQQLEITATTTASTNTALDPAVRGNTITVNGKFSNPNALVGQRIQTKFGDGSGYGLKVESVTELTDSTVLTVGSYNPFRVTDQGVDTLFFPELSIPGKVYVVFNQPKFTSDFTPPVTTDNAPAGWVNQYTTVSLNAVDVGSGVAATYYTVDGGAQQSGNTVLFNTEGVHKLVYWSVDNAGNLEQAHTVTFSIDKTPPVTTAVVTPLQPDGLNGWYVHPVTVSLNAYDALSGAAKTEYSLDDRATWQRYTAPVTLNQDSKYTLSYRSTDIAGNVETAKTISFNLDTIAPTITISEVVYGTFNDSGSITPVISLVDNLSGFDNTKTTVMLDANTLQQGATIPLYKLQLGLHTLVVSTSDLAGNQGSETVRFQTVASIDSLKTLVTHFADTNLIDNAGIANSLQAKLAKTNLKSFVNEVQAQSGKHISSEAAKYLLRDAESILLQK